MQKTKLVEASIVIFLLHRVLMELFEMSVGLKWMQHIESLYATVLTSPVFLFFLSEDKFIML